MWAEMINNSECNDWNPSGPFSKWRWISAQKWKKFFLLNLVILLFFTSLLTASFLTGCAQDDPDDHTLTDTGLVTDTGGDIEPVCSDDDLILCGDVCRDLESDSLHCGECDNQCQIGYSCVDGQCELVCPSGQTACDDGCYNLQDSPQHCGDCNTTCNLGESCVEGECLLVCPGNLSPCSGVCVDLESNTRHCGACENQCDTGIYCVEGECQLICPPEMEICNEQCVYLDSDSFNCGACGVACQSGKQCIESECSLGCGTGQTVCDDACVNLQTDRSHCGLCGNSCEPGNACFGGQCLLSCPGDLFKCDDTCANLKTDQLNCGQCGNQCSSEQACNNGWCVTDCPSGRVDCDGGCVNTSTDRLHCGWCNNECDSGMICENSECVLSCPGVQVACGGECVYTDTDTQHCGGCNQPCANGQVCSGGECGVACGQGFFRCGDTCADLMFDRNHCGACDNGCLASQICTDGECVGACPGGFEDCGECVDVSSNINHCGACNNACTGGAVCRSSACYLAVTSVTLNHSSLTILLDQQEGLTASILPAEATDPALVWQSSDGAVAVVDGQGLVTAMGPGTATITATNLDSNRSAVCTITVIVPVTGVEVSPTHISILPGGQGQLAAIVIPANATNQGVSWSSSDQSLINVDAHGLVRASSHEGEATVTVTTADGGFTAEAIIAVSAIPVTGVIVEPAHLTLIPGEVENLSVTISPANATNTSVIWTSSIPAVAKVHSTTGVVTAVAAGQTVISAITADGGHTATCTVTVSIPVTGVSLSHNELTMNRGESFSLVSQVHPASATNIALTWSSDDLMVAFVSNDGTVTAVGAGQTAIRIISDDGGYTAACVVEVLVPVTGIVVTPASLLLWPNEQGQLDVQFTPPDATNQQIACSSSKREVAIIDCETLTVTGLTTGSSLIGVTSVDSLQTVLMQVNVARPVTGVTLSHSQITLGTGQNQQLTVQVTPADATDPRVVWESSDPHVATVNSTGKVTGVAVGQTTITVRSIDGGYTVVCSVKVMLYAFTNHTFSTCGVTGRSGPTVAQCKTAYASSAWAQSTAYFNVNGGIQFWTVPQTGTYRIEVWGAQGGNGGAAGGLGARMRGDFALQQGEKLKILVGQQGSNANYGGGGGGSYVFRETGNAALIVAGGGGGGGYNSSYNNASRINATVSATGNYGLRSTGSNAGQGGTGGGTNDYGRYYTSSYTAGGGGGVHANGQGYSSTHGIAFLNGGTGGAAYSGGAHGGFGGGGGSTNYSCSAYCHGGGGGGYAGGGAGYDYGNGGGGGSYNAGTNPSNTAGTRSGHGQVTITLLP